MDYLFTMLSTFANYMMTMDMVPVCFFGHFVMGNIIIREDSAHLGGPKFPRKHPFTSWMCAVMTSLSGAFIADLLFGNPILDILKETALIIFLTIVWYMMNFSPYDFFYKLMTNPFVFVVVSVLQEFVRTRVLFLGVQAAAKAYPNAPLIIMLGGIIKGNGYGFIKMYERLVRGHWQPEINEFLKVSYFAKSGAIASLLFLLHHMKLINIPVEHLYLMVIAGFIVGRLILVVGGVKDPLAALSDPICRVVFGSWEDEKPHKAGKETNSNGNVNNNKKNNKKKGNKKTD